LKMNFNVSMPFPLISLSGLFLSRSSDKIFYASVNLTNIKAAMLIFFNKYIYIKNLVTPKICYRNSGPCHVVENRPFCLASPSSDSAADICQVTHVTSFSHLQSRVWLLWYNYAWVYAFENSCLLGCCAV
jgi:hypothetical protein